MGKPQRIDADSQLFPGDVVMLQYELNGTNQKQIDLAVHQIKQSLSQDKRVNYQGSEIITGIRPEDGVDGEDRQFLNVYVQVAKGNRTITAGGASGGVLVVVMALVALVAFVDAGISMYRDSVKMRTQTVNGIARSDLPADVKAKGFEAVAGNSGKLALNGWVLLVAALIVAALAFGSGRVKVARAEN